MCWSLVYFLYFYFTFWAWYLLWMLNIFLWWRFYNAGFYRFHYFSVYLVVLCWNLFNWIYISEAARSEFVLLRIFYNIYCYLFCLILFINCYAFYLILFINCYAFYLIWFIYLCILTKCILIVYSMRYLTYLFNLSLLIICYLLLQYGNIIRNINSLIFFWSKRIFLISCFI